MAIYQSTLRMSASRPITRVAKTLSEAKLAGLRTAFLCHSHLDRTLVEGFISFAQVNGFKIYIDWMDTTLPSTPDRQTASKIKLKIKESDFFLFLATQNSTSSRWCPWEIGYADGVKPIDNILIINTIDDDGRHYGNEYLQLYRKLTTSNQGPLAVFRPGEAKGVFAAHL